MHKKAREGVRVWVVDKNNKVPLTPNSASNQLVNLALPHFIPPLLPGEGPARKGRGEPPHVSVYIDFVENLMSAKTNALVTKSTQHLHHTIIFIISSLSLSLLPALLLNNRRPLTPKSI